MPVNVAQLVVTVGANTAMAEQGIMGLARMLGSRGILALGAVGAGLAIAGVVAASVKMAGDFQTQLTQIVTGAGESQSNLKLIQAGVLQMARDTGTSTKQLTDGLYMIESGGYHGAQALAILQAAAEGAKVGASDLGVTADVTDTILKNYPNVVNGAAGAVNTLIATVAHGKTHMQDLSDALAAVLPTAAAAGVGLNDVMAAMAAQTAAGVPAADAATHLRQMLIALEAPSKASKKALEAIGLTTDQLAAEMHKSLPDALQMIQQRLAATYGEGTPKYVEGLKDISGGLRQMQGMLVLTSQTGMKNFQTDVGLISQQVQQGGQQIVGWNLVQGTFNQSMAKLGEIFQTVMIALGTQLLPVATRFANLLATNLGPLVDGMTGKTKLFSTGLGGDLMNAAKLTAGFFETTVIPTVTQLGQFFEQTIVPIVRTFAHVLLTNVLPALLPVAKTIMEKWLPPLERIGRDVLPVLTPLLQIFGQIFQNVIGPALGLAAGAIGTLLNGIADLTDAILKFTMNPSINSFVGLMKGIANAGNGALNTMTGGVFHLPHFASGGAMVETGLALVGENGPEVAYLPGGTQITPVASLPGATAGTRPLYGAASAGGQPVVLQIDGRRIAHAILPYLPDAIRQATGARHM